MPRKILGPLPLLSGLQTSLGKGSATGLRACMNVEARDGMVRTRRGTSIVNWVDPGSLRGLFPSTEMGGFDGATFLGMRVLAGADRYLMSIPESNLTLSGRVFSPGCVVSVCMFYDTVVGPYNSVEVTTTAQYLASDGTWKDLVVLDAIGAIGARPSWSEGYAPFSEQPFPHSVPMTSSLLGAEKFFFVAPDDWTEQQAHASFPSGYNIRLLWSDQLSTGIPNSMSVQIGTESEPMMAPKFVSIATRKGERNLAICSVVGGSFGRVKNRVSDVFGFDTIEDYEHTYPVMYPTASQAVGSFSARLVCQDSWTSYLPFTSAVYVPHTDDVIIFTTGRPIRLRTVGPARSFSSNGDTAEAFTPVIGTDADAAYRDIPLEVDIPPCRASGYFADRVFIGNFPDAPFDIMWSAPGDAWEAWPSSNRASLGSGAAGEVRAFASHGGGLYVFTARGIYVASVEEGSGDNESDLFIDFIEDTGCVSPHAVVSTSAGIVFLAPDGLRLIVGRGPSRPLVPAVSELFRMDSAQQFACLRGAMACAAWDRVEDILLLAYPSPGATNNDTVLAVDMKNRTAWLWGAPLSNVNLDARLAFESSGHGEPGSTSQRSRGLRITSMAWSEQHQCIIALSADGLVVRLNPGESTDVGAPIVSSLETQTLQLGMVKQSTVERVDVMSLRDHFDAIAITVIPDGDESRAELRQVSQQRDRLSVSSAIGAADIAGQALSPLVDSFAPFKWRGRKKCRNARVRIDTVAPSHAPLAIVSVEVEVQKDEGGR